MTSLYLLGAGGHARVIFHALRAARVEVSGVVDPYLKDDTFQGLRVLRDLPKSGSFIVAVGQVRADRTRERIWNDAIGAGLAPAEAFCEAAPTAGTRIGSGSIVLAGAYVAVGTTIGQNCIVNHLAIVEHDCAIADHVHVSPGAVVGGEVRIGTRSHIGIGAVVRQGVAIGDDVTVGAGAVVVADVPSGATVVGVPARPLGK